MTNRRKWSWDFLKSKDRNVILICVGIALIFWLTTKFSREYTHDYTFDLQYDLPENSSFTTPPVQAVEARLSGSGWDLFRASMKRRFSRLHVPVTRSEITRTDLVQALYRHLGDYDVQVRQVNVDVIDLDIDMVIQKDLPVRFTGNIRTVPGFQLKDSVRITPNTAHVTGPLAILEDVQQLEVAEIDIPVLKDDFTAQVDIISPNVSYVTIEPSSVNLTIEIEPQVQKALLVPVSMDGDTAGIEIQPNRVRVICTIGESKEDSLTSDQIEAVVHIDRIARASGQAHIDLQRIPAYIRMATVNPEDVQIISPPEQE